MMNQNNMNRVETTGTEKKSFSKRLLEAFALYHEQLSPSFSLYD